MSGVAPPGVAPPGVALPDGFLDCIDDAAKAFYEQWDFAELPGHPYRLVLGAKLLAAMMDERGGSG